MIRQCFVTLVLLHWMVIATALPQEHNHSETGEISEGSGPEDVVWFTEEALFGVVRPAEKPVDTTITNLHLYDFADSDAPFYASKGNVGHAVRNLRFAPRNEPGFRLHQTPFYPGYLLALDSIRYYRPGHVFSELYYVLGSDREQLFHAKHNQRLHDSAYGGFKYLTVNSSAPYASRLRSRNANFLLYLEGKPLERYHVAGSFIINRVFNHESGGLKDHVAYEQDEVRDSVFMYSAETRIRDIGFRIQQSYHPVSRSRLDADTPPGPDWMYPGRFRHVFTYKRQAFVFDEPTTPLDVFYPDEDPMYRQATYDSTVVYTVSNRLDWSNLPLNGKQAAVPLHMNVFVQHQSIHTRLPLFARFMSEETAEANVDYPFQKERYSQIESGIYLQSDPLKTVSFTSYARYIAGGYNDQDYGLGGTLYFGKKGQSLRLAVTAALSGLEAPYFMQRFQSNYVAWENDFDKTTTLHTAVRLVSPHVTLHASYTLADRPVFMNDEMYPEQSGQSVSVYAAGISGRLRAGVFRTHHSVTAHYITEDTFERFPPLVSYHSFYTDFSMFDNALHAHAGFDMRYNSPYKPMAYMPVVRQFHIQNQYRSDHEVLANVFVNASIGRARLFVKLQNILDLVPDRTPVYDIPFYPLPGNMFKFGISWMFFD